ncbi:branched-chain amino acid ABC transporter permease [Natrarchaeobius sp. A-rgal3]|uniref:branched-chain amino acid ABC transporter permease n=1 Tax=Natrarchaeobius versutus TaxID=1679078 RepID=UPI00350F661C
MSTDTLREVVDGESSLVSWETWDRIKHTEWFVFAAATTFVALFSYFFRAAPLLQGYHGLARTMLVWAIFALAFNLLLGQTGLLSFGHAMFWGGAAYAAALFAVYIHSDPLFMIIVGTLFAMILAFVSAFILLRLHTVYFAIVTLAIAQMLYYLVREPLEPWTNGINGLSASPDAVLGVVSLRQLLPGVLGTLWVDQMYLFIGAFFIGVVVFITRIRKSPYGLIFKAVRENETRASFVGLDVWRYKFAAYLLSGTIAGIAGALYTVETGFTGVNRLFWETSGDVVVMTVLGGLGTLVGPVLGAIVFFYFEGVVDGFAYVGRYWLLLLAIAFTAVVWKYPDGLWGMLQQIGSKLRTIGGDR